MPALRSLTLLCLVPVLPAQEQIIRVHGLVVDENEQPLAGVAVSPFCSEQAWLTAALTATPAARTRADGTFELAWDIKQRPAFDSALFVAEGRVHVAAGLAYLDMMPVPL